MRQDLRSGIVLLLAIAGGGCHSTTTPTQALATIGNLTAAELGLQNQICGGLFEYAAVDEVKFDVIGAERSRVLAMSVYQDAAVLSAITECPVAPACTETKACLVSSSGTTHAIRVRTVVPWSPSYTWTIRLGDERQASFSNQLSTTIQRPDGLPSGTQSSFVLFTATRTNSTSASFELEAYSPGIAGRSILFTMTATSNGAVVTNTSNIQQELPGSHKLGLFGGFRIAPGSTDISATLTEKDGSGNVIAQDTRTVTVQ